MKRTDADTDTADSTRERLARVFKALSNPNRLRLFEEIRREGGAAFANKERAGRGLGGCLLQHVIDALDVGAPTVSHHLKELVNAGLVVTERRGRQLHCHIPAAVLDELARFFAREDAPPQETQP